MGARWLALATLLAGMSCSQTPPWALPPDAEVTVRSVMEDLKPSAHYERIRIDHDHVLARLCPSGASGADCFDMLLTAPVWSCRGAVVGSFCVVFPDRHPAADLDRVIASALQARAGGLTWVDLTGRQSRPDRFNAMERVLAIVVRYRRLIVTLLAGGLLAALLVRPSRELLVRRTLRASALGRQTVLIARRSFSGRLQSLRGAARAEWGLIRRGWQVPSPALVGVFMVAMVCLSSWGIDPHLEGSDCEQLMQAARCATHPEACGTQTMPVDGWSGVHGSLWLDALSLARRV